MSGLRAKCYELDYDDYHSFIHGRLPYENIKPDPILRSLLLSLPLRKIIFTNFDKLHAAKAVETREARIFDIIGYLSDHEKSLSGLPKTPVVFKPSETAIVKALAIANVDPHKTLFFDDSVRNIQAGKRVGLNTVLVGTAQKVKCADFAIENIHNLKEALPELWESEAKPGKVRYSGELPVETPVVA
ncbi:unnamed protein product [Microthlaspi erraticum]|uniref:FCP1 homology domain-containing protein n=1 Tax=Microthlaspi erraticum TaxID=1685480 RepID=A0A6D2KCV4_9BRAS|nr:unnamed protein product [Microthlaspi erraticum]